MKEIDDLIGTITTLEADNYNVLIGKDVEIGMRGILHTTDDEDVFHMYMKNKSIVSIDREELERQLKKIEIRDNELSRIENMYKASRALDGTLDEEIKKGDVVRIIKTTGPYTPSYLKGKTGKVKWVNNSGKVNVWVMNRRAVYIDKSGVEKI